MKLYLLKANLKYLNVIIVRTYNLMYFCVLGLFV